MAEPDFGMVVITDLPPHPRNTRDRLRPLFLKALQHHMLHPHLKQHQGWFKVYNRANAFARAIPAVHCVPGAITWEQIDGDVNAKEKRLKKKAVGLARELGAFEVRRRGGAIYLKHTGRIPDEDKIMGWFD